MERSLDDSCASMQVHIKRCGSAYMLLNTSQIPGMTPRLLGIAEREKRFSQPIDSKAAGTS